MSLVELEQGAIRKGSIVQYENGEGFKGEKAQSEYILGGYENHRLGETGSIISNIMLYVGHIYLVFI